MKVRVAYVEESPFYSTSLDGTAIGADIELADIVLRAAGASSVGAQYIKVAVMNNALEVAAPYVRSVPAGSGQPGRAQAPILNGAHPAISAAENACDAPPKRH